PGTNLLPIGAAAAVFWNAGEDPEVVARRIRTQEPTLSVVSPADAATQIDRALAVMNGVIVGSGLVALVIASLAVTNTMFTAVVERRREIGLRRIVGATYRQVVGQLVLEAAVLGTVGGLLGLVAGAAAVAALNTVTERFGPPAFLLTGRLAFAAAVLPAGLSVIAGLWP